MAASPARMRSRSTARNCRATRSSSTPARVRASCRFPASTRSSTSPTATSWISTQVPRHLIALGGNYLGLEFGQMFRRFGSEVTVVELSDQIIPREDPEVSESLKEALEGEGMTFRLGAAHHQNRQDDRRRGGDDREEGRHAAKRSKARTSWCVSGRRRIPTISVSTRQGSRPIKPASSSTTASSRPTCPASGCWATSKADRPSPMSRMTTIS